MVFKRVFMPILVLGIVLAMGTMAFAQAPGIQCSLVTTLTAATATPTATANGVALPGPTARATLTGHTEPVAAGGDGTGAGTPGSGRIRVSCSNVSGTAAAPGTGSAIGPAGGGGFQPTALATAQISYGVSITNGTAFPTGAIISVVNTTGAFAAGSGGVSVGAQVTQPVPNNSGGTLTVTIGTAVTFAAPGTTCVTGTCPFGSFDITGVLVSFNGTGKTRLDASLSISGGAGYSVDGANNTKEVVTAVSAGLKDPVVPATLPAVVATSLNNPSCSAGSATNPCAQGGAGTFNLSTGAIGVKQTFAIRIDENYQDLFKNNAQFNGGGVFPASNASDTVVQLQFNNIPAGINIGGCTATLSNGVGDGIQSGTPTLSANSVSAGAPIVTVNFNSAVDLGNVDSLWVACSQITAASGTTTLPSTPVTVQVTLAPAGGALTSTGGLNTANTNGQIPRYQLLLQPTTGVTVVTFPPATVSLLIPFATVGGGYNTGIAISNTTTDPLGSAGASTATAQNGTITFTLYDNSGTVKTYTTVASSPGGGLASGVLNSGKTYVVNLSEILTAAGAASTFTGYVFVATAFTNAHGAAYVYNGAGFTSATPVLVVEAPQTRGTPESLGQ